MAFSASARNSAVINVTPLIDVLLVLLIIFMVITPGNPHGLASALPAEARPVHDARGIPLIIRVIASTRPGAPVRYRIREHDFDLAGLQQQLRAARTTAMTETLWIRGDPAVDYHAVVEALAAAKAAGFSETGLLPRGAV